MEAHGNIFYRVADGLAAMGMARIEGERLTNDYHFSKELIANSYSSFMVPKYSPLKVLGKMLELKIMYTLCNLHRIFSTTSFLDCRTLGYS